MLHDVVVSLNFTQHASCKLTCSYATREFRLLELDRAEVCGKSFYIVEYIYDNDLMWRRSFDDFIAALEFYHHKITEHY